MQQIYAAIFFHGLKKYGDHLNCQTIGFVMSKNIEQHRATPKSTGCSVSHPSKEFDKSWRRASPAHSATSCSGYPSFYLSKLQSYFGIQYPMFGSSWSAQKPLRPPAQTRRAAGLWSLTASAARKKSRPTSTWGSVQSVDFSLVTPPKKNINIPFNTGLSTLLDPNKDFFRHRQNSGFGSRGPVLLDQLVPHQSLDHLQFRFVQLRPRATGRRWNGGAHDLRDAMVGCGHPHVQDEVVSTEMNHRHVGIHMDSPWNPGPRETHGVSIANCSFTGGALKGGQ